MWAAVRAALLPRFGGQEAGLLVLRLFYADMWWHSGQPVIAISMLSGALSPVAAVAGILATRAAFGTHAWGYWPWTYYVAIASQAVLALTFPVHMLSADAWAWRRWVRRVWSPRPWLAGLRVLMGLMLAPEFLEKITPGLPPEILTPALKSWLLQHLHFNADLYHTNPVVPTMQWMAAENPNHWFQAFLLHVAIPNGAWFSVLVPLGEGTATILLLVGLFTPAAAGLAIFLLSNYWLGAGYRDWSFVYPVLIAGLAAVLLGRAGRWLGLDAAIVRWPRAMVPW